MIQVILAAVQTRVVVLESPPEDRIASVVARISSNTVGVALADVPGNGLAKVRSFFVEPDHMRKGIGTQLAIALEERAKTLGAKQLEAMFEASGPFGKAAEHIAETRGWKPSQPRTVVCRANAEKMANAPFMQRSLPPEYEMFLWRDLTQQDKDAMLDEQATSPWYTSALDPFQPPPFDQASSLGLKRNGKIVGWMIAHRLAPHLVRFSSLFVRGEERGTGLALLCASIQRAVADGATNGIFGVNHANATMLGILQKHLAPFLDEYREIAYVAKEL